MHKWIQALMVMLTLTAAYPSAATIITGADGPLAPTTDYTLPYRADGIFDFASIEIGAGITLRFDAGITNATLLSLGGITIAGLIDATRIINLTLETLGQINITGTLVLANGSDLFVGKGKGIDTGTTRGSACISVSPYSCGSRIKPSIPIRAGLVDLLPEAGSITRSVPEPGTLWLMTLLLPMPVLLGRKCK